MSVSYCSVTDVQSNMSIVQHIVVSALSVDIYISSAALRVDSGPCHGAYLSSDIMIRMLRDDNPLQYSCHSLTGKTQFATTV